MKASDLRIGNYYNIYAEGKEYTYKVGLEDFCSDNYKNFEPIPLTEEWLLKFRFHSQIGYIKFIGEDYQDSSFEVAQNDLDKWYCYFRNFVKGAADDFVLLRNDLKHVHQLQNLYHSLTNKELEIC